MPDRTTHLLLGLAALAVLALAVLTLHVGRAPAPLVTAAGGGTAGDAEPTVRTVAREAPYAVAGTDAQALLASMVRNAPHAEGGVFFGLTTTELSFRYGHRAAPEGCALAGVRVDLLVTTALPVWTPPATAPSDLRRDWTRFAAALGRHEAQHRTIGEAGARRVQQELAGLTAATCTRVDAEARRRAERAGIETEAAHRRYDDETGHGRTQGATWPIR